ncbi:regulator of chromosome condensation [Nemania sp. NC0429]|nr:regulator of chromosome condensation [Nemania sp. NC0429]
MPPKRPNSNVKGLVPKRPPRQSPVQSSKAVGGSTSNASPRKRKLELESAKDDEEVFTRAKRVVSETKGPHLVHQEDVRISKAPMKRAKAAAAAEDGAVKTKTPTALPIINKAPTQVLQIIVFGSGECGELGLGPSEKEKPRAFLDCGGMHTVALISDNRIVTWGVNDRGALGRDMAWDGGLRDVDAESDDEDELLNPVESTPTQVPADAFPPGTTFVQVVAGDSCSFALTDTGLAMDGDAECKPRFIFSNDNLTEVLYKPSLIPGLENITRLACGANHAIALDQAGHVWAWGAGQKNQLGYRLFNSRHYGRRILEGLQPHRVNLRRNKGKHIASGLDHSFAVDQKDNVWAWGLNRYGQAGYTKDAGSDNTCLPYPMKIPDLAGKGVTILSGGADHSVAVTASGQCFAWGRIDGGQLGVELTDEQSQDDTITRRDERGLPRICLRPILVPNIGTAAYVGCGTGHTIFIDDEGKAYGAGFGSMGQLGIASEDDATVAERITGAAVKGKKLVWCGAGGQFSMVASPIESP